MEIDRFDEFYDRYPRKVGKGSARRAYAKALKWARHDDIMHGLSAQIPMMETKNKEFIAHPATWLNGERWLDELEEYNGNGNHTKAHNSRANAAANAITFAGSARRTPSSDSF